MTMDLNKVLITGANGMVGSYVDFGIKTDRDSFDITNFSQVSDFIEKEKPSAILHLAAETDLAKCDSDPSKAYMINSVATYNLAVLAKKFGAKIVYVSTDAVFPYSEDAHSSNNEPNPESVYGHSKYLGELAIRGVGGEYIIIRTSWIFGGGKNKDKKFVGKLISQLDNPEAKVVNDQINSPTYAKDLIDAVRCLVVEGRSGIFNVVNSGRASRYDMAIEIVKFFKKDIKILSVDSSVFGSLSYQKSSGGLVSDITTRTWQEALREYLEKEWIIK